MMLGQMLDALVGGAALVIVVITVFQSVRMIT
jgi:hypothetical protein